MTAKSRIKTWIISGFILFNLFTVLLVNLSPLLSDTMTHSLETLTSSHFIYKLRLVSFRMRQYANWVGLDSRWEMFSHVKGYDWRYRITARDAHNTYVLPLAGQSERSFLEATFFDFKEGKFRLNTAGDAIGRHAYINYLCHKFATFQGNPIHSIKIEIQYQKILEPRQALQYGYHFAPEVISYPLEAMTCTKKA